MALVTVKEGKGDGFMFTRRGLLVLFCAFAFMTVGLWQIDSQGRARDRADAKVAAGARERLAAKQDHEQLLALVGACHRGNVVRAWSRWDAHQSENAARRARADVADQLFPILNCTLPPPFKPLPPRKQQEFIDRLVARYGG